MKEIKKIEENSYYWNGTPIITYRKPCVNDNPTVVELFCGCGGTSLGFEQAGYNILLGCDILKPAIETFLHNHPNTSAILGDIAKITANDFHKILKGTQIDVLIGGVPCQGFSLNNKKRQNTDTRNFLYKEFIRCVNILKPKVIVIENVTGMKSSGTIIQDIQADVLEKTGFKLLVKELYAPDYGVPQKRTRLVFVGVKDNIFDFNDIQKTHGEGTQNPYTTVYDAIGDLPSLLPNQSIVQYDNNPLTSYQELMRNNVIELTNHTAPNHPISTIQKITNTHPGKPIYERYKQRIRLAWDIQSPTQVAGGIRPQFQFAHPKDNRGLTVRERCRIQSFPDTFYVCGGIVQGRIQTGNAVPPLLAKALAKALLKYINK